MSASLPTPHLGWYKPHIHRMRGDWRISYSGYFREGLASQALRWAQARPGVASRDTALIFRPSLRLP